VGDNLRHSSFVLRHSALRYASRKAAMSILSISIIAFMTGGMARRKYNTRALACLLAFDTANLRAQLQKPVRRNEQS
jgi:hypothetical protein